MLSLHTEDDYQNFAIQVRDYLKDHCISSKEIYRLAVSKQDLLKELIGMRLSKQTIINVFAEYVLQMN